VFTPALTKHTKSFNLIDTLAVGVHGFREALNPFLTVTSTSREPAVAAR
jgi:hypothetical protein